jgi:hypothetical protein
MAQPVASASPVVEHYVTLFDNNYLPIGLCLYQSLLKHGTAFVLWVLCMDERVEQNLRALDLLHLRLLPLAEVETPALQAVKPGRSRGEYCWTITSFSPEFVFARAPEATRVTYLDADLFFFRSPEPLFGELTGAGKDILITEHAFAPEYDSSELNGRFCVQFMTFRRTAAAAVVLKWWQARCIDWCYDRHEDGKFGDQKYLDQWPGLFGNTVHILTELDLAMAPWNADYRLGLMDTDSPRPPVFYHFHGLRIVAPDRVRLFSGHRIRAGRFLYAQYVTTMHFVAATLRDAGIPIPILAESDEPWGWLRKIKRRISGRLAYASF